MPVRRCPQPRPVHAHFVQWQKLRSTSSLLTSPGGSGPFDSELTKQIRRPSQSRVRARSPSPDAHPECRGRSERPGSSSTNSPPPGRASRRTASPGGCTTYRLQNSSWSKSSSGLASRDFAFPTVAPGTRRRIYTGFDLPGKQFEALGQLAQPGRTMLGPGARADRGLSDFANARAGPGPKKVDAIPRRQPADHRPESVWDACRPRRSARRRRASCSPGCPIAEVATSAPDSRAFGCVHIGDPAGRALKSRQRRRRGSQGGTAEPQPCRRERSGLWSVARRSGGP